MNMPGFTAEVSLYKPRSYNCVAQAHLHFDAAVYPAQRWGWVDPQPIYCPFGWTPVLVKTGGERVCRQVIAGRCISWERTRVEQHWECFPHLETSSDLTAFHQLYVRGE
jgi:hypothetical protein